MIDAILAKIFGTKNTREIKAMQPLVAAINDLEPRCSSSPISISPPKPSSSRRRLAQGAPSTIC